MEEKNDMISVIVPIYKVEEFLDECIQSIVDQTYQNLQIILVDDGSPDHCGEMCEDWAKKDKRIEVIHKKKWWTFRCTKCWSCCGNRRFCCVCRQ